jgi:stringent starvation protein B
MAETSTKPYMIRALYEWCCDNGYTPYLAVTVDANTLVPRQHVKAGEIVLNVSPMATSRLSLGNELVEFQARFSGVAQQISIPVGNVSAIYARETGQGMAFEVTPKQAADDDEGAAGPGEAALSADDEGGVHAPGSTVQSLRGGSRRRGPRSVGREAGSEDPAPAGADLPAGSRGADEEVADAGAGGDGAGSPAANSRKRSAKGQGSADVIAFAPSSGPQKKSVGGASGGKTHESGSASPPVTASPEDDDEPPPGEGGGKSGKARLTRVK